MAYIEKDEALAIIENRQREICPNGRYSRNDLCGSDREAFDNWQEILDEIEAIQSADVAPVPHGRCDVCSGKTVLTQDADNGYSLEIDSEQQEASLWYGDNCLAVFHIDFCPVCGCCMDGGAE